MQTGAGPFLGAIRVAPEEPSLMLATELSPLSTPPPLYPPTARARRQEGFVEVEFTVAEDGKVRDIRVIRSDPPGVFERAAERSVRRWRFEPHRVQGEPMAVRARQRIEFELR
jgi:protein TonB